MDAFMKNSLDSWLTREPPFDEEIYCDTCGFPLDYDDGIRVGKYIFCSEECRDDFEGDLSDE